MLIIKQKKINVDWFDYARSFPNAESTGQRHKEISHNWDILDQIKSISFLIYKKKTGYFLR